MKRSLIKLLACFAIMAASAGLSTTSFWTLYEPEMPEEFKVSN